MVFNSTRETKSYRPGLEIPTRSWTGNLPAITSTGSVRRVQPPPTFGTGTARWNRIHCAKLTSTHNAWKPSRTSIALVSFPNLFPLALPTAHIQLGFSQVTSFPTLGVDPYRNYVSEVPNGLRRRSTTLHTSRDLVENLHRRKKIYQLTTKSFHLTRPWKTHYRKISDRPLFMGTERLIPLYQEEKLTDSTVGLNKSFFHYDPEWTRRGT